MTTATATLTEFLLARLAEAEEQLHLIERALADDQGVVFHRLIVSGGLVELSTTQLLADIEAKRRIVALHFDPSYEYLPDYDPSCTGSYDTAEARAGDCDTLRALASVYADRPGFREEWRL